jgi:outer membrane murein-binding lipoprotein Lpp
MTGPNPPFNAARFAALVLDVATLKRQLAALPAAGGGQGDVDGLRSEVSGLGEQVDALTAHIESLGQVASAESVTELAAAVVSLQEAIEALYAEEENTRRSWFELAPEDAAKALTILDPWVRTILTRHGKPVLELLRPCWWQHPLVVEELLVLAALWRKTYRGRRADWDAAVDWHHKWLPGFLDRVRDRREFGDCESEHAVRPPTISVSWEPLTPSTATGHARDWAATRADWPPPRSAPRAVPNPRRTA